MKLTRPLSALIGLGIVLTPIAAQARTRPYVPPKVASTMQTELGTRSSKKVKRGDSFLAISLFAAVAMIDIGGLVIVTTDTKSRGAS